MIKFEIEKFEDPLKECEEMEDSRFFKKEEARKIMLLRKNYQNDIEKPSIDTDKIGEFIKIESSILKHVTDECDINKDVAEFVIATRIRKKVIKRIANLFEYALRRFPTDRDLLIAFITFCRDNEQQYRVNNIIAEMEINLKPENIHMWLTFANWHFYNCDNINAAMNVLLKGIEIHISNTVLYIELVKILLHFWSEYKKLTKTDGPVYITKMEKIMGNTFNNVTDLNFYIELLGVLETKEFTGKIQEVIILYMKMKYKENVLVWHTIAQKYYKGSYADNDYLMKLKNEERETVKSRWVASCTVYTLGLQSVPLENQKKMYELYLEFLFNTVKYGHGTVTVTKRDTLNRVLQECHQKKYLTEKHYLEWAEFDEKNAINIYENGISNLCNAPELRDKHLLLLIIKNDVSAVENAFNEGVKVLNKESLPLWMRFIRYHSFISSEDRLEEIYKQAVTQPKEISDVLKPEYLDWIIAMKGIEVARNVYWDLANREPYCKELHKLMSKTESLQMMCNYDYWYRVHNLACEQFGKEDVDVWIRHVEFYVLYNKNIVDLELYVEEICRKAENALPGTLFQEFRTRYQNLRNR